MSLTTRCPACGTAFKVVPDQLKVSHGWVRCGQCMEVFDASSALEGDAPAAAPASVPAALQTPTLITTRRPAAIAPPPPAAAPAPASAPTATTTSAPAPAPAPARSGASRISTGLFAPSQAPSSLPPATGESVPHAESGAESSLPASDAPASGPQSVPPAPGQKRRRRKPQFVRQAEREERWQQPGMRAALATLAAALAALLAWQAAWHYRDDIAARWPAARDALDVVCGGTGCRIEAPRAIDRVTLESGTLLRTKESGVVQLSAALRNRADFPVQVPAMELTLTDELGRIVTRRVLMPAELGVRPEPMAARGELSIDARLHVGDVQLAGYQIDLFYP